MRILKRFAGLEKEPEVQEEELYDNTEEELTEEELDELEQGEEASIPEASDDWLADEQEEGQLSVDVYQTPMSIVVKSTIAGVKPQDIDIAINNDMLTIRGKREMTENIREQDYLYRECYWGSFSRSIILPTEIKADKIEAFLENGVLSIVLPKAKASKQITIKVKER